MAGVDRFRAALARPRTRGLSPQTNHRSRPPFGRAHGLRRQHRLPQHDRPGRPARIPGRRGAGAPDRELHPLERDGDGGARQPQEFRVRRAHRHLRIGGDALRSGLQPFLARADEGEPRRPRVFPGPFLARHLCARVPGGPADPQAARPVPPGGRRRRPLVLPASLADVGLLAVPDRIHGPGRDDGDLPGALHALPGASRPRRDGRPPRLVHAGRRRNGRAGIAGRDHGTGARAPGQPDLRGQLQPAASRRAGARERQDHPGAGGGLPGRRLERDQVDLGFALGPASVPRPQWPAAPAHGRVRGRRVSELQGPGRRIHPREVLRRDRRPEGPGGAHVHRGHRTPEPGRPRPPEDLRRLRARHPAEGAADGDPGQDREGVRHGRGRREPHDRPPGQEAGPGRAAGVPRPLQHPGHRRGVEGREDSVPQARRKTARRSVT